jgi:hypothetical protein
MKTSNLKIKYSVLAVGYHIGECGGDICDTGYCVDDYIAGLVLMLWA